MEETFINQEREYISITSGVPTRISTLVNYGAFAAFISLRFPQQPSADACVLCRCWGLPKWVLGSGC
jgi:hypothetical protein